MAMTVVLLSDWSQPEVESVEPMSAAGRRARRAELDKDAGVMLYEILPTHPAERAPGAWGHGLSPEQMMRTWRQRVDSMKRGG